MIVEFVAAVVPLGKPPAVGHNGATHFGGVELFRGFDILATADNRERCRFPATRWIIEQWREALAF
jgi:hypothetical protein